jgi:diguanylate cyclase (GGDEF)-like protein
VGERMRETVRQCSVEMEDDKYPSITISAGVAHLIAGDDFASLIKAADVALYKAKELGRDRVMKVR